MNITELNGRPLRLLIGGFPCTKFSIAQKKDRETVPYSGEGWELFYNYLLAKEKFKPDLFLAENNQSISQEIKDEVSKLLGVDYVPMNSALVSAQQRKRVYWYNWECPQPEDRGILLKDILEDGIVDREKAYCLKHQAGNARDYIKKHHTQVAFKPVRIGDIGTSAQAHRVYPPEGKSVNLTAQGGKKKKKTGLYATPINITSDSFKHLSDGEMNYMTRSTNGKYSNRWAFLNNSNSDKSVCMVANFTKGVPYNLLAQEIEYIDLSEYENVVVEENGNVIVDDKTIYLVLDGEIGYKDDLYPINLPDGYYIIRKLTVKECERLQTMPEGYVDGVISNSQAYKCLGNGWTAEIIIHILTYGLRDIPKDYPIEVLSMYDGIGTGRYCLDKMGYTNITYKGYEVDKYAIQAAMKNYPNIIQCGDAFQLREEDWAY